MNPEKIKRIALWCINRTSIKFYIGSVSSQSFKHRWNTHRRSLLANKHENPILQRAWNKYGSDSFIFQIIEIVKDKDIIYHRESFWLSQFKSKYKVFNIVPVGMNPMLGRKHTKKTKEKIKAKRKLQPPISELGRKKISDSLHKRVQTEEEKRKRANHFIKPYPTFTNIETQEVIPPGINLKAMCEKRGFNNSKMSAVARGDRPIWRKWVRDIYYEPIQ